MNNNRVGFPSVFKAAYETGWDIKNTGYDYNDKLLNRTLSSYMFKNPNVKEFLEGYLNPIVVKLLNTVKYIRIFYNYAVPKDYQKIN